MFWIHWRHCRYVTAYKIDDEETDEIPFQMMRMNIEPVYKNFEGWKTDITAVKQFCSIAW